MDSERIHEVDQNVLQATIKHGIDHPLKPGPGTRSKLKRAVRSWTLYSQQIIEGAQLRLCLFCMKPTDTALVTLCCRKAAHAECLADSIAKNNEKCPLNCKDKLAKLVKAQTFSEIFTTQKEEIKEHIATLKRQLEYFEKADAAMPKAPDVQPAQKVQLHCPRECSSSKRSPEEAAQRRERWQKEVKYNFD